MGHENQSASARAQLRTTITRSLATKTGQVELPRLGVRPHHMSHKYGVHQHGYNVKPKLNLMERALIAGLVQTTKKEAKDPHY